MEISHRGWAVVRAKPMSEFVAQDALRAPGLPHLSAGVSQDDARQASRSRDGGDATAVSGLPVC